jgi:hypothetical protein
VNLGPKILRARKQYDHQYLGGKNDYRIYVYEIGREDMDWIKFVQDRFGGEH